jgi:hypothetical protein
MLEIVSVAVPVLLTVDESGDALVLPTVTLVAKVRLLLESDTLAVEEPVPLKFTICVAGLALSAIVTIAVSVPLAIGAKVTYTVQLPAAAKVSPEYVQALAPLVRVKSTLLVPPSVMLVIERGTVPVLLTVTG